jgi:hypothetical protein
MLLLDGCAIRCDERVGIDRTAVHNSRVKRSKISVNWGEPPLWQRLPSRRPPCGLLRACESIIHFKLHASPAKAGPIVPPYESILPGQLIAIASRNSEWRRNGSRPSPGKRGEILMHRPSAISSHALRMRCFLRAIKSLPHPEERPKGTARRTHDGSAALRPSATAPANTRGAVCGGYKSPMGACATRLA